MLRIRIQEIQHLAYILNARLITAATPNLRKQRLTFTIFEPIQQGAQNVGSLDAGSRGARAVGIEVLVHVEDEVGGAAVRVGDAGEDGR